MSRTLATSNPNTTLGTPQTTGDRRVERGQHWTSPYAARRIHLIGVGGCGMSGLAGVLLRCGAIISGSDRVENAALRQLEAAGATIRIGQAPINVSSDCDLVVFSAAIQDDNPELQAARRLGLECVRYAEMLGRVMGLRTGIAVSGTHGKSTTSALLAYILRRAGRDPTFVIGAHVEQLGGGSGVGDGPHFVTEACEFDQSFLNLRPQSAAILNLEEDHLDYFADLNAIIESFASFASLVPADGLIVANGEDRNVAAAVRHAGARVETFGFSETATWRAANVVGLKGCYAFDVCREGGRFVRVRLTHLAGRHQISNALAATALAHDAGIAPDDIAAGLATFRGADRRLTKRGEASGILVLDDYGHHPTEIQVTLRAVREQHPNRRLWVVFQPHQHSRTRFLLNDFARSFGQADRLLVPDIYFVRDSEAERDAICSQDLVDRVRANGGDAQYLAATDEIVEHILTQSTPGDVVLTMGAGDVWKIADALIQRLG